MTPIPTTNVELWFAGQWVKQRKLHMIWRAIARRHLSCVETPAQKMERASWTWADLADGESDP